MKHGKSLLVIILTSDICNAVQYSAVQQCTARWRSAQVSLLGACPEETRLANWQT